MLSDKQINEISAHANWEVRFLHSSLSVVIRDAIEKALAMAEKSRWKHPDKGELPEVLSKHIIFHLNGSIARPRIGMAYKDSSGLVMFFCNDTKQGSSQHHVKYWTYAPALEEE